MKATKTILNWSICIDFIEINEHYAMRKSVCCFSFLFSLFLLFCACVLGVVGKSGHEAGVGAFVGSAITKNKIQFGLWSRKL